MAFNSSASPSRPSALVSTSTPLRADEPTPTDLLLSTPPAILKLLTLTAPAIQAAATFASLLTWTHPSLWSSLVVLLAWWALCLFGRIVFLYGLNGLVLAYILGQYLFSASTRSSVPNRHRPATLTPAAYTTLLHQAQELAAHVHTLRTTWIQPLASQFSFVSHYPGQPTPAYNTAWFALTSYPFYLAVTYFVPSSFIFLVAGSVAILWNAPFFTTLRLGLKKSAAFRWAGRVVLAVLRGGHGLSTEWAKTKSGVGVPGLLGPRKASVQVEGRPVQLSEATAKEAGGSTTIHDGDVELLFTIMENQRWWVGLDWTHALLPGERASWTDPGLHPSSPPASFTLPPASVTLTPSPTHSDPDARIKRTTEWKWLDPEWKVQFSSSRPTAPVPISPTGPPSPTFSAGAGGIVAGSGNWPNPMPKGDETFFKDWHVDEEGWQYGDNAFEKMGQKGGLGKYTRRRAWIRRAGLVEREERIPGSPSTTSAISSSRVGAVSTTNPGGVGIGVSGINRVGDLRSRSGSRDGQREGREREKRISLIGGLGGLGSSAVAGSSGEEVRRRKASGPVAAT